MRLKTLNGAPLREHLDFSPETLRDPLECELAFQDFLDERTTPSCIDEHDDTAVVKWRHVDAQPTRLRTAWSQPYLPQGGIYESDPSFSYSELQSKLFVNEADGSTLFQDTTGTLEEYPTFGPDFLQHSLVLHDTLLSSQLAPDTSETTRNGQNETTFVTATSFTTATTETSNEDNEADLLATLQLPANVTITSLNSLPSASHLRAIYPQTPTPTFICALTSQVEQREVFVKKGNYNMHLYELTVADETSAGFKLSFWFPPGHTRDQPHESLRHTLQGLQVGDILLLRNIVLAIFRDAVHGQSLSPRISKARSTVEVLLKTDGSSGFERILPEAVNEKFTRLKRWVHSHIVPDFSKSRKRKGQVEDSADSSKSSKRLANDHTLPPDTMEPL